MRNKYWVLVLVISIIVIIIAIIFAIMWYNLTLTRYDVSYGEPQLDKACKYLGIECCTIINGTSYFKYKDNYYPVMKIYKQKIGEKNV